MHTFYYSFNLFLLFMPMKLIFNFHFALCIFQSSSQVCGPNVPSYTVDLTFDPNASWISPDTVRNDVCCGASGVRCIEFIITLHPDAEGIILDIYSGAVPGGALFYQVNCSTPAALGDPICLIGPGPHSVTSPERESANLVICKWGKPGLG